MKTWRDNSFHHWAAAEDKAATLYAELSLLPPPLSFFSPTGVSDETRRKEGENQ